MNLVHSADGPVNR